MNIVIQAQDPQEEKFSRGNILKIIKIIERKESQEDFQEEFRCTAVRSYVADFSPNLLKLDMY